MENYIERVRADLSTRINVPDDLLDLYTLLVFAKGEMTSWDDVHNAWAIWKNRTDPQHRSLIPFDELTEQVQQMDEEYANAIRASAASTQPLETLDN